MTVGQVISMANGGELKSTAIEPNENDIVEFINLALIELYKRFPLKTSEYLIELVDNQIEYTMPSDFMYISSAYEELPKNSKRLSNRLGINDEDDPLSVNMISWNTVQIPVSIEGSYISIIYVSAPQYIIYDDVSKSHMDETIEMPPQLLEALLSYIGYRGHGSITSELKAEDNTHYQRFEASCNRAKRFGLVTAESLKSHYKFKKRGFA